MWKGIGKASVLIRFMVIGAALAGALLVDGVAFAEGAKPANGSTHAPEDLMDMLAIHAAVFDLDRLMNSAEARHDSILADCIIDKERKLRATRASDLANEFAAIRSAGGDTSALHGRLTAAAASARRLSHEAANCIGGDGVQTPGTPAPPAVPSTPAATVAAVPFRRPNDASPVLAPIEGSAGLSDSAQGPIRVFGSGLSPYGPPAPFQSIGPDPSGAAGLKKPAVQCNVVCPDSYRSTPKRDHGSAQCMGACGQDCKQCASQKVAQCVEGTDPKGAVCHADCSFELLQCPTHDSCRALDFCQDGCAQSRDPVACSQRCQNDCRDRGDCQEGKRGDGKASLSFSSSALGRGQGQAGACGFR